MLRKRVLDIAVEEINEKTDLFVRYDLETVGRKTISIVFEMRGNEVPFQEEETHYAIRAKLERLGLKKPKIDELLTNHDEQYLRANIAIVEEKVKKGKIANITAYLLKAFHDDYRPIETEYDREKKAAEEVKQKQFLEEQQEQLKKEGLRVQYEEDLSDQISHLLESLSSEEITSLKDQFVVQKGDNPLMKKFFESKGFENPIIQHQRKKFLAVQFLSDEYKDFEAYRISKQN